MDEETRIVVVVVSSVASMVTTIIIIVLCMWCPCFKKKSAADSPTGNYQQVPASQSQTSNSDERGDVKRPNKHSWRDRIKKQSSPHLTRKTINAFKGTSIRFQSPGRKMTLENVQPETAQHSSLNRQSGGVDNNGYGATEGRPGLMESMMSSFISGDSNEQPQGVDNPCITIEDEQDTSHNLGRIFFTMRYDFEQVVLILKVAKAVDLPAKDFSGTSDPYVKVMLLPDKKHKLETKIKKKTLNPSWNETFLFEGFPHDKLKNKTLYLQVLDFDRFSRDDPIGDTEVSLADVDLTKETHFWKALHPCKGSTGKLGEVLLSLCYEPTVGRITVVVMKTRELKAADVGGTSDPYVKIWLMQSGKRVEKKKTTIKVKTRNAVFNESFIYNVPMEKIRESSLLVSVMDYDKLTSNDTIGHVLLGRKSGPMEVKHWNEMLTKPRQPVAQWHILRDLS